MFKPPQAFILSPSCICCWPCWQQVGRLDREKPLLCPGPSRQILAGLPAATPLTYTPRCPLPWRAPPRLEHRLVQLVAQLPPSQPWGGQASLGRAARTPSMLTCCCLQAALGSGCVCTLPASCSHPHLRACGAPAGRAATLGRAFRCPFLPPLSHTQRAHRPLWPPGDRIETIQGRYTCTCACACDGTAPQIAQSNRSAPEVHDEWVRGPKIHGRGGVGALAPPPPPPKKSPRGWGGAQGGTRR